MGAKAKRISLDEDPRDLFEPELTDQEIESLEFCVPDEVPNQRARTLEIIASYGLEIGGWYGRDGEPIAVPTSLSTNPRTRQPELVDRFRDHVHHGTGYTMDYTDIYHLLGHRHETQLRKYRNGNQNGNVDRKLKAFLKQRPRDILETLSRAMKSKTPGGNKRFELILAALDNLPLA